MLALATLRARPRPCATAALVMVLAALLFATDDGPALGAPRSPAGAPGSLVHRFPLGRGRLCCGRGKAHPPAKAGTVGSSAANGEGGGVKRRPAGSGTAAGGIGPVALVAGGLLLVAVLGAVAFGAPRARRRRRSWLDPSPPASELPAPEVARQPVPAPRRPDPGTSDGRLRALGYVRTPGSRDAGHELDVRAQIADIAAECKRRDLVLTKVVHDVDPHEGPSMDRPGLSYALDRLGAGEGSALVVSALEHLSRSPVELSAVIDWFAHTEATLVVVGGADDNGTPVTPRVGAVAGTARSPGRADPEAGDEMRDPEGGGT